MSTGVGCTVYVAGERLADGSPGDNPLEPTVLSGLSFTWGRGNIIDQPEASTCSFQLLDDPGGTSFLTLLRTGLPVDVVASGTIFTDPDTSTVLDPSFTLTPVGETPGNVRPTNTNASVQLGPGGRRSLQMFPADANTAHTALIAPGPFSTAPGAWDDIPATAGGQRWKLAVDVFAPIGATVSMQPVAIFDTGGARIENVGSAVTVAGNGTFRTLQTQVIPAATDVWLGMRIRVFPTGPRWAAATGTWAAADGTWRDRATTYIDDVQILAPEGGLPRTVLAFSGRITDLTAGYDEGRDAPVVNVICADFTADLDNVRIGDLPWQVEQFETRFHRVLALAGLDVDAIIDDGLTRPLSYQDVDSQAATGLLKDLAQSVDGVMWSAVHQTTGPYVHVEDPTDRAPMHELTEDDGVVIIQPTTNFGIGQEISACDVLRNPVRWEQSVADVATRVAVTWLEQGVDEEGRPQTTERTTTIVDQGLEATYGQRGISLSTLLQDAGDAEAIAQRILTRTSLVGWRVTGLTIDDDESIESPDAVASTMLFKLLDGTSRNGLPIILTGLPDWAPVSPPPPRYTPWEEQRRNLMPRPHPVAGQDGWRSNIAAQFPLTVDSDVVHTPGVPSVRADRTTTSLSVTLLSAYAVGGTAWSNAGGAAVTPGQTYTASLWGTADKPFTLRLSLYWWDAAGVQIGSTNDSPLVPGDPGNWVRAAVTATAPAGAVAARMGAYIYSTVGVAVGGEKAWITEAQLEPGTVATAWFAGSTPDTTLARTRWLGTPNGSASVLETRQLLPPNRTLPVYLEGGTYAFEDGAWRLALTVSRAEGQGRSVQWSELDPEWAWNDFDPDIAWDDLVGVVMSEGGVTP